MLASLTANLEHFTYVGIFGALFLSSVGLPAPEEVILILTGYLVSSGLVNIWGAILVAYIGVTAGDNLAYQIGLVRGEAFLNEFIRRLKISRRRFVWTKSFLDKHCAKAILFSRFLLAVRFIMPYMAGAMRIKRSKYLMSDLLAAAIWVPGMIILSYYLSQALDLVVVFRSIKHWIFIAIILVIGFIAGIQEFKKEANGIEVKSNPAKKLVKENQ